MDLDPLLLRQLRKAGITDPAQLPPSPEAFRDLLQRVNDEYKRAREDRDLLTRSLDLSTSEMEALRTRLEMDRDRLLAVVTSIGDALGLFQDIATSPGDQDDSHQAADIITDVKDRFTSQLTELYQDTQEPGSDTYVRNVRDQFLRLADVLAALIRSTAHSVGMKKELELAGAIQHLLVPTEDVITRPGITIAGHFQPAAVCGGDWWTVHDLAQGAVLTAVGDVTGHGVASAILTGVAKAACDVTRTLTSGAVGCGEILELMNTAIYEAGRQQRLMTCVATVLDPEKRTLRVASAGHRAPLLLRGGQVIPINTEGAPLGASRQATFAESTVPLQPNDMLVWYTDGLTECENERNEQFSERRLRSICLSARSGDPRAVRDEITRNVKNFIGTRVPEDDLTFVVGKVH
ncbi:MAG TPA: PP2C family protein-serine/threonine phosphatase [Myxococcaceae bacterium]|nr:PP2C family protein-serine/threonine phosphatase [Myxococcaceae bacterium]